MARFEIVANAVRAWFVILADWLYGCSHRKTSFPITLRAGAGVNGQRSAQTDTYVVCLECGRRLPYDWTMMRITRPRRPAPETAELMRAARCDGDA
jgi:hypothetical protein